MCWHKWSKWSDPEQTTWRYFATPWSEPIQYYRTRQSKVCSKCGKIKYRYMK